MLKLESWVKKHFAKFALGVGQLKVKVGRAALLEDAGSRQWLNKALRREDTKRGDGATRCFLKEAVRYGSICWDQNVFFDFFDSSLVLLQDWMNLSSSL